MELMSKKQWKRLDVVERTGRGKLTVGEAARVLGLSERQVRRLRRAFEKGGRTSLLHGNLGVKPSNCVSDEMRAKVVSLRMKKYAGFNDQHFTEKLREEEHVALGRQTVRRILRAAGIGPVRKRRPRRHHGRRLRKAQAGMMLLWDGSLHDWLEGRGPELCLMGAIDDATGELLAGAHFVEHECSAGYLRVLSDVCKEHGLPLSIYMDRHSSLHRNDDYWTLEEELRGEQDPTQVGAAIKTLEIEAIYALSAQAKGRVERLWGTLQDRLVSELRLAWASTAAQANAVLAAYRPKHNERFAKPAAEVESAWRRVRAGVDLERICSFRYDLRVRNDNTVHKGGAIIDIAAGPGGRTYAGCVVELRHLLNGMSRVYLGDTLIAETPTTRNPKLKAQTRRKNTRGRVIAPPTQRRAKLTFKEIVTKLRAERPKNKRTKKRTESLAC
jgi:transposase